MGGNSLYTALGLHVKQACLSRLTNVWLWAETYHPCSSILMLISRHLVLEHDVNQTPSAWWNDRRPDGNEQHSSLPNCTQCTLPLQLTTSLINNMWRIASMVLAVTILSVIHPSHACFVTKWKTYCLYSGTVWMRNPSNKQKKTMIFTVSSYYPVMWNAGNTLLPYLEIPLFAGTRCYQCIRHSNYFAECMLMLVPASTHDICDSCVAQR